jgi:hypothetical protein
LAAQTVGTVLVPPAGLWVIDVTNAGDAGARIVGSSYFGTTVDGRDVEGVDALDLRPLFDPLGVVDERDYRLLRIVPGFGIPVGGSVRVMELPLPVAHRFTRLGLTLTYTGPYGERTAITVEAHPPHGLPGDLLTLDRPADPSPSP